MATRANNENTGQGAAESPKPNLPAAVTLAGLQKDYGKAEGERLYHEVALRGGFGDIRSVSHDYAPDLALSGLKGDQLKAVEEVFASAKAAKE